MFRPFNLTSIAAWTAGSLAGNQAYFASRQKSSGLKLSKASNPPSVQNLLIRLDNIRAEVKTISEELCSADKGNNQVDLIPLLKLIAYCHWLRNRKDAITEEIKTTFAQAQAEGFVWQANVTQTLCANLNEIVNEFSSDQCLQSFNDTLAREPHEMREKIYAHVNQLLSTMLVDESSWKLPNYKGPKLLLNFTGSPGST
jgi:hypothetical protein